MVAQWDEFHYNSTIPIEASGTKSDAHFMVTKTMGIVPVTAWPDEEVPNMDGGKRSCPECGAPLGDAKSCEELFHAALAMEWVDPPRTAEAHHLLVATYMLQHPSGYTPAGQAAFASLVIAAVDEDLSSSELRERNRGRFDQDKRDWNLKAKEPSQPRLRKWDMTIADAIHGPAQDLPERVLGWARRVREELHDQ